MKTPYKPAHRVGGTLPVKCLRKTLSQVFYPRGSGSSCSVVTRPTPVSTVSTRVSWSVSSRYKTSCEWDQFCVDPLTSLLVREAATKEEACNTPKKYFLKIGEPPDSNLTAKMNKSCVDSEHPSIFICDKTPGDEHSRKSHFRITKLLREIKKREKKRKLKRSQKAKKSKSSKAIKKRKGKGKAKKVCIKKGKTKRKGLKRVKAAKSLGKHSN